MKICHAFPFFSVRFAGGTSDLMFKLAKAQLKAGQLPIIYSGDYNFDTDLAAKLPGARFEVLRSYFDKEGFSIIPGLPKLAHRELGTYDVVHMHVFRTYQNVILYRYCKKFGIPFVMDAHGSVPYATRKPFIKRTFDNIWGRQMLNDAAWVVAETQVGVQEYLDIEPNLDRSKLIVLSPPFDTDEFQVLPERGAFRKELGIEADEPVIMFLGRINHIKGNDFLIKGFAHMLKDCPDARLVLIGSDDGHMDDCKRIASELGVSDRVMFPGFLAGNKKLSALVDADIVAQMSRQEQGAWAPFEAVLCGTPIIVTDHTGSGEDVRRINAGETTKFDDVEDLASKLLGILRNYKAAKVKTMAAKHYIESNMSFNGRIGEYTSLYTEALRNARKLRGS